VEISQNEKDLLGAERFVADHLATPEECQTLIDIAKVTIAISPSISFNKAMFIRKWPKI